jgi:hypothetical protein
MLENFSATGARRGGDGRDDIRRVANGPFACCAVTSGASAEAFFMVKGALCTI